MIRPPPRRAAPLVLLLLGMTACGAERGSEPTPGVASRASGAVLPAEDLLLRGANEPPENTFGLVADVAVGRDGRVYVLDVLSREVSAFTPSGERTARAGRPGEGPGEFQGPAALAVRDATGEVYAYDERNRRIEVFDTERLEVRRSVPLDFHARDLCFIGERLYLLGARGGYLLHELSPDGGTVLRSFLRDPESEDLLLAGYRGHGYLGCAPSGEIAFLPSLRSEVRRFRADTGESVGATEIPGYVAVRVRPTGSGGMRFDVPGGGGHDFGGSILPLPGGDWLVQAGRMMAGSGTPHEFESIRSYLLRAADGEMTRVEADLPRIMASRGDTAYAVETSPYPAVRILPGLLRGRVD